jgi:hypothetical protein
MSDLDPGHEILIEAVEKLILEHTDPGREWDGDDAAETIQARFLEWLPDILRHRTANGLRRWAKTMPEYTPPRGGTTGRTVALEAAERVDPFRLCYLDDCDQAPHWVRKSDGENVPHGALQGDEGNEED